MIGIGNHFGEVQRNRQIMLQKQHFFEALAKILEFAIGDDQLEKIKRISISRDKVHRLNKADTDLETIMLRAIKKIAIEIYGLLVTICDKNPETQAHAYKFIHIYIKHIGLELEATEFILSILRNNEKLMLGIKDNEDIDIVNQYSSMLVKSQAQRNIEILEFLTSICVYKGEGASINQEKVFSAIFKENKRHYKKILILTEIEDNTLKICLGHMKISLISCFESGRIIGYDSEIQYFTSLLELYSNLCKGRNFESAAYFMPQYPLDIVHTMI